MTEKMDKKKRPRPANLDLSSSNLSPNSGTNMNDIALKCLSPGLPPLSAKMKSTVLISKSIEAQQRHIIASRNLSSEENVNEDEEEAEGEDEDEEVDGDNGAVKTTQNNNENNDINNDGLKSPSLNVTPSTSGLTNTMEGLSIPSSNKRLRREKAPPPLNLNLAASAQRPAIKSAPIYNVQSHYYTPLTARRSQFRKAQPSARPRQVIFDPYQRRAIPLTSNVQHYQRTQAIPSTATVSRNPIPLTQQQLNRYQQQLAYQQQQWSKFKEYQENRKVNHVTDVFQGDSTRYAPPSAQPLSAQRAFFNLNPSIKPQIVTASKNVQRERITEESDNEKTINNEDEDGDDPESNAIEPEAQFKAPIRNEIVKSELRISNNVFKFDFQRYDDSPDNDKQRFLNHCALAWNQFTSFK